MNRILVLLLLFLPAGVTIAAEEFTATDGAMQALQSRRFDNTNPRQLLLASLAILQDLHFQVTESELDPGLLVAHSASSALRGHTLTLSLRAVEGRENSYEVRLSTHYSIGYKTHQPDYTDFYQEFLTQLNQELFREE